jgi:hypothetical protein
VHGLIAAALVTASTALAACEPPLETETGLVIAVDAASLTDIRGFTLHTPDGRTIAFATDRVAFDQAGFPPQHLREHMAGADPVRVTYRVDGGRNVVIRLEDAPRESR